jgi:hypothetical protein
MGMISPGAGEDPAKIVAAKGEALRAAEAAFFAGLAIAVSLSNATA